MAGGIVRLVVVVVVGAGGIAGLVVVLTCVFLVYFGVKLRVWWRCYFVYRSDGGVAW